MSTAARSPQPAARSPQPAARYIAAARLAADGVRIVPLGGRDALFCGRGIDVSSTDANLAATLETLPRSIAADILTVLESLDNAATIAATASA